MKEKYIAAWWESYSQIVVPAEAGPVQIKETRQAFFAGASVLFAALSSPTFFDGSDEATENDLGKVQAIQDEVDEFGAEMDVEVLDPTKQ